jgi:tetratricopeptide (TPR) repeat protein
LEEKRLQNSAAIQLYQQVPADHPRASAAAAATARCYDRLLQRLRELTQPTETWETEAIERLTRLLPPDKSETLLTEDQAVLALHLSNIVLQTAKPDFAAADRWLEWVSRSAQGAPTTSQPTKPNATPMPPAHWVELNRAASRLRVVSLAGQGRYPAAEQTLADLASNSPSELLSIIDGLSKLVAQAQTEPQHHLGELQLRAALNLKTQRDQLSAEDQLRLDRCIAEAYVAAGRYEQAIEPFREQLKNRPNDVTLLTSFANLLMKFGQRSKTEEAQGVWKQIESRHKSGSPGWLEARYQFARCELELGNPNKALKLINVTRVLFPQMGGPETQKKFQELQAASEQRLPKK